MMLSGMWFCMTCVSRFRSLILGAVCLMLSIHVAIGQQTPAVPELSIRATTRLVTVDTIF